MAAVPTQTGEEKALTAGPEPAGDVGDYQKLRSGEACCCAVVNAAAVSCVDVEARSCR